MTEQLGIGVVSPRGTVMVVTKVTNRTTFIVDLITDGGRCALFKLKLLYIALLNYGLDITQSCIQWLLNRGACLYFSVSSQFIVVMNDVVVSSICYVFVQ